MVSAANLRLSPVLKQACLGLGAGPGLKRMCSDRNDAWFVTDIRTDIARLTEEIDTAMWPIHTAVAL